MIDIISNNVKIGIDEKGGLVNSLKFGDEKINWLISNQILEKYNYLDAIGSSLGKSVICYNALVWDTSKVEPCEVELREDGVDFIYYHDGLKLVHKFIIIEQALNWTIQLSNLTNKTISFDKVYHWMPVAYIMHESIQENLDESCSLVPSLGGSKPFIICKRRDGRGQNLIVINETGHMKSVGSWCKYKNLFFEKSAPSLSGMILHNVVNSYQSEEVEEKAAVDWQYKKMYTPISLEPEQTFTDQYSFLAIANGAERKCLLENGIHYVEYPPIVITNEPYILKTDSHIHIVGYALYKADDKGEKLETKKTLNLEEHCFEMTLQGPETIGERKLILEFADGSHYCVNFAVYESLQTFVDVFCEHIYKERFITDESSSVYAAYQSVSRQGESCAKGSFLLYKNIIAKSNIDEVQQVEKNAVYYLRKRWLDDSFLAIKQYPGGFARIIDLDYLILEFYLLSLVDSEILKINNSDTYLLWAYKTAVYRFENTPDKLPRELEEVKLASMISWLQIEMVGELKSRGYLNEATHLEKLWERHIEIQLKKIPDYSFIQTEHYFDNAGISLIAEVLLNSGHINEGLLAADLLLHNVADTNDYRAFAPDRWWEALATMYHNLWAVFSAKALLTAYEKSSDNRFLISAYKAMMPMFYNYDYKAVSALNTIEKGEGVSTYCITSPNLNLEYASRNHFGQSVFKDDFFKEMDLSGDDWDMGADMFVYLTTFGQSCYVTHINDNLSCINGAVQGNSMDMTVKSYAAYPSKYYIELFDFWIVRGSKEFTIQSIKIINQVCTEVIVKAECQFSDIHIYEETKDKRVEIYPEIIISHE